MFFHLWVKLYILEEAQLFCSALLFLALSLAEALLQLPEVKCHNNGYRYNKVSSDASVRRSRYGVELGVESLEVSVL